ncbi:acetamidase/formamidase family protein [Cryptosporangium minutisporangium]|uniref:Acetamidase/formamidase family protein n=1 Tax=Cryptosporangium minutisporangium TaxID=113569 RepID=A0ABP6T3W8_9ACTN
MTLQAREGRIPGDHYLETTPETALWGFLPNRSSRPALSVESGAVVTIDTLSHEGILEDQGRDPVTYLAGFGVKADDVLEDSRLFAASDLAHDFDDGPHVVTGPIAVAGAEPGDLLRVDVLELAIRVPYGFISNRHGYGALPGEFPEGSLRREDANLLDPASYGSNIHFTDVTESGGALYGNLRFGEGRRVRFPLRPFLGLMGVAVDTDEPVPSVPPGDHGGNMDVNELQAGSSLYLPVQTVGALFYAGDPHYAQGDGEVALTALEAPLRATLRLSVLKDAEARAAVGLVNAPFVETDTHWIPVGMDPDLNEAMRKAVRRAVSFLELTQGMPRATALAYLSAAGDFEVSQVVDAVKGVHCLIRKADFGA